MPRYIFSLESGHTLSDLDGEKHPNDAAAKAAADEIGRRLIRNVPDPKTIRIVVRRIDGSPIGTVG